jgi:DHA2 family multidrug resistance protein-like MFS transporter
MKRKFMFRQWLALVIIVLVYIPVAIDATVLHVAAPTLSMTLAPAAMNCCGSSIFTRW